MATYTVDDLMGEVHDLMCARLPRIPGDDPGRRRLAVLLPAMAAALDRPPLRLVSDDDRGVA